MKQPDAILVGDVHLTDDQPVCRTDNFWSTQWTKLRWLMDLQKSFKFKCKVIQAGDLFDHWKPSPMLLNWSIRILHNVFTVYGQHDLPQHNLNLTHKSGTAVLESAGVVRVLDGCHYGQKPTSASTTFGGHRDINGEHPKRKMLVWHKMNWTKNIPYPGCKEPTAKELLKKYPEYDVILTGDNHQPFTAELDGRILINPGSFTRLKADQVNHRPRVYLYYADENAVRKIYVPIDPNAVSREHLKKDVVVERHILSDFVEKLMDEWNHKLSLDENLNRYASKNRIRKDVMKIIRRAMDDAS